MNTVGIILAGGKGERFGGNTPKQFLKLAGKTIIEHTIEVFENSAGVDEIIIVCQKEYQAHIWEMTSSAGWKKVTKIVNAGEDRMASTYSALQALASHHGKTKVLIHDAVRPFVSSDILERCISILDVFTAADVVIPSTDTLVSTYDNGTIAHIPDRSTMRRGQTPQAFHLDVLKSAYEKATVSGRRNFSCDCGVLRAFLPQTEVATVQGADSNIKITTQIDLFLAEKLMQQRNVAITDRSQLSELKGKQLVIFGGNSGIGKSIRDMAVVHGANVITASRSTNSVNVADFRSTQEFLQNLVLDGRKVDAIINTAAVMVKKPLDHMSRNEVDSTIGINFTGAVNVALASKEILRASSGVLINFTSSSYTRGRAFYALYSSTKCAVVNFTQALAEEWFDEKIRVHCINPERTKTPMRTLNFGEEDPSTLLSAEKVAEATLRTILSDGTGLIVDVKHEKMRYPE